MNFKYIESVTHGDYVREGRFWDWIEESLPNNFSMETDSIMVCGSPELNKECRTMFQNLDGKKAIQVKWEILCLKERLQDNLRLAESEGFEPSIQLPIYLLSREALSTTQPTLRN